MDLICITETATNSRLASYNLDGARHINRALYGVLVQINYEYDQHGHGHTSIHIHIHISISVTVTNILTRPPASRSLVKFGPFGPRRAASSLSASSLVAAPQLVGH